jgi:hypothetical protein
MTQMKKKLSVHMTQILSHSGSQLRRMGAGISLVVAILLFASLIVRAQSASWQHSAGDVIYGVAISGDASIQVVGSRNNRVMALDAAGDLLWEFQPRGTVWGVAI